MVHFIMETAIIVVNFVEIVMVQRQIIVYLVQKIRLYLIQW
jgi:hypothetical protein